MTTLPDLDRMHAKVSAAPVSARRKGFAVNIGGAQGGGEPLGAPRIEDLWEIADAYPAIRAYVAALEAERDASRKLVVLSPDGSDFEFYRAFNPLTAIGMRVNLEASRLATDAAREKMEDADG